MKKMFTVISLLILIQCLAGCGSFVDFRLSAQQFGNECLSTSEAPSEIKAAMKKAEKKYLDKTIEITGTVCYVGAYATATDVFVKMYDEGTGTLIKEVLVTMKKFDDVQKIKKGDLIKVKGKFDSTQNEKQALSGYIFDRYKIFLIDGELVK